MTLTAGRTEREHLRRRAEVCSDGLRIQLEDTLQAVLMLGHLELVQAVRDAQTLAELVRQDLKAMEGIPE